MFCLEYLDHRNFELRTAGAQRGVVCAASYEARKFGVRSAMASVTAKRLCPDGCFVRPRMDADREESQRIMEIIVSTGAVVEQMSVDEAYLDVSSVCQAEDADPSLRLALPLARELKTRIWDGWPELNRQFLRRIRPDFCTG